MKSLKKKKKKKKKIESHLKDMEGFKLDVPTLFFEHGHHQLEVVRVADVPLHHREVVAVQQQLSEQLQRLPFGDVILRVE